MRLNLSPAPRRPSLGRRLAQPIKGLGWLDGFLEAGIFAWMSIEVFAWIVIGILVLVGYVRGCGE